MVIVSRIICAILLVWQAVLIFRTAGDPGEKAVNAVGIQLCAELSALLIFIPDLMLRLGACMSDSAVCVIASVSITVYAVIYFFLIRFVLDIAGVDEVRKSRISCCNAVFIAVTGALLLTNPFTSWMFTCSGSAAAGEFRFQFIRGIPALVYVVYCVSVLLVCILVLIAKSVQDDFHYPARNMYLIAILLLATAGGSVIVAAPELENMIFSLPDSLLGASVLMYYFVYRYRPRLSLVTLRLREYDALSMPVLLFNTQGVLADFNCAAACLFGLDRKADRNLTFDVFCRIRLGGQVRPKSAGMTEEISMDTCSGRRIYKLDCRFLKEKASPVYGTLLSFTDITELRQMYDMMEKAAMTDRLTGLAGVMKLERKISEINLYRKYPYCAVACGVSGLRFIQTGFGDSMRDMVQIRLADALRQQLRTQDFLACDGERFIALLPDADAQNAESVFNRVNDALGRVSGLPFSVTIDYGASCKHTPDTPMQDVVAEAKNGLMRGLLLREAGVNDTLADSLRAALEESGRETAEHARRVGDLSLRLGRALGLDDSQLGNLQKLALYHDIGKQTVSASILAENQNNLTEKEFEQKKLHVLTGYRLACMLAKLEPVAYDILSHHERWDGKGYPAGLAGNDIPYLARIFTVADTYDALTHDRIEYTAVSEKQALDAIASDAGHKFDPRIVETFISLFR